MNTVQPAPIPFWDLRPAFLISTALLLLVFLVQFDQGAVSQTGLLVHELIHDARHLLGVPCH